MTEKPTPSADPCGPGKLQIAPTRSIRLRTEIPGPVARELLARHAQITPQHEDPFPIIPQKAHGTLIYDVDGNVLIDFSGRAGLTGYTPDHLVETLRDGVENLIDVPQGTSKAAIELAERLVSLVPGAEKALLFGADTASVFPLLRAVDVNAIIADERFTGLGRTGALWSWSSLPDAVLVTDFAAGLPIGAIIGKAGLLDQVGYMGIKPPAITCAAALSVMDYILANDLPHRAGQIEARVKEEFANWGHANAISGSGVLLDIALESVQFATSVLSRALQNGLILARRNRAGTIRFEPPLMCPEEQLNEALDVLRDALDW